MVKFSKLLLFVVILTLCVPVLTLCLPAMAQITTGTVEGRVVDPQGAVVRGADVMVMSTTTNVAHSVKTNQDGLYTVPLLQPGTYTISVAMPNFEKELRDNVTLQIGQTLDLDFKLSVGATTQTVTVTTAAPLVQTQSAAVGTVVDNQKIIEIPLNGRQFYSLSYLVPGVNPPVENDAMSQRGGLSVGGQQENSNYYTLDGIMDVGTSRNAPSFRPSIDAIQEFKVLSGTYEAQYGHAVGGQIIVTDKSGGNHFHGDVFEFVRNQIFDAENYFNPLNIKPLFSQNNWGATLGGPILRDKFFFFFSYEGLYSISQYIAATTVPTVAQIGGNFTSDDTALTAPTGYANDTFVNNVLNLGALKPSQLQAYNVAQALLAYYPHVTTPGSNNYTFVGPGHEYQDQFSLRLDSTFNAKNSIYVTMNYFNNPDYSDGGGTLCSASSIPGFQCFNNTISQLYGGGWTHLFTANLINTAMAGFQRIVNPETTAGTNINVDGPLGIPDDFNPAVPASQGVPGMSITGYATYGANGPTNSFSDTYDYADSLLYNKGTHSFVFGAEYILRSSNAYTGSSVGSFTFQGPYTGNPLADAVLGLPSVASLSPVASPVNTRYSYFTGYAQDTWKVTPYLTLNYGLRWEKDTPVTSDGNRDASFNPITGEPYQEGVDGVPRHLYYAKNTGFSPRLGLSYRPFKNDNTVIQAGFGTVYDSPNLDNTFYFLAIGYPLLVTKTYDGAVATPLSLPNPYTVTGSATLNVDGVYLHFVVPVNANYSFGVQQQLAQHTALTLNYSGSETAHETISYNINQSQPQTTAAEGLADRPWPQWNNVTIIQSNKHSTYNALFAKVQQTLTHGLSFLVAYTWAKSIDNDSTPQNIYNTRADRGLSTFDVRNRFVASPVYDLPFGVGRQFLNHGWAAQVVGGWEVAGQISLQDGTPVTPILGSNVSNDGRTTGDRPNVIGNPNNGPKTLKEWFNTSVYSKPANGTFGDSGVDTVHSPGYKDADINIARTFILPRRMSVQFRAEMFDAFNHPNFSPPGVTYGTSSFGVISTAQTPRQIQFAFKLYY
jgi:Carboxypeptidase regulatory-like domain/TonB-dependent Receptor Plug Domain